MKNIQVIDGASNCAYSIFQISDESFSLVFPEPGQDVEFIDDFILRVGEKRADDILAPIWASPIAKPHVTGLHGTLFYELPEKKKFYPNKREDDLDDPTIQRNIR